MRSRVLAAGVSFFLAVILIAVVATPGLASADIGFERVLGGTVAKVFAFPDVPGGPLAFAFVKEEGTYGKSGACLLYRSRDSGKTWEKVEWLVDNIYRGDEEIGELRSMAALSDGTLVLTGSWARTSEPFLLYSRDGGTRWESQASGEGSPLVAWAAGDRVFGLFKYRFGSMTVLKVSDDRGRTWPVDLKVGLEANERAFTTPDGRACFVVSDAYALWATADGGTTWRDTGVRLSAVPHPLGPGYAPGWPPDMLGGEVAAVFEADGSLTAVACSPGAPAGVYISRDGGKTWKQVEQAQFEWRPKHTASRAISVAAAPGGLIFAGTPDDCVLVSEDYGVTWKPVTQGVTEEVHELACFPSGDSVVVLAATPAGLLRMEYQKHQVQVGGALEQGAGGSEGQNQGQMSEKTSPPAVVKFVIGQRAFWVGDQKKDMDAEAFTENGRTYMPVRYLGESLGAEVGWDGATQTVTLAKSNVMVKLVVGDKIIYVNGQPREMDVAPLVRRGRTYLPARYVAEALGYKVGWDPVTQAVSVMR
ncbi:stalk domain-containing protein [Desulfovirgula thermocuniculi]|uniref:stalk domain-containing protein n=1 Tax=Desulfovirgula thermocuniculi TaxID=348842 RepID=UPI0003FD7017|nr:stalk domain-containing protein [Desulfovirgula thermocuniculi]